MKLIRKLALALFLALLYSSYSNAQVDYTTGNLINSGTSPTDTTSVWNNGVYVNQLCFAAGQAGNCGPNPSIRASSGNINFSYGQVDLNQVVNINKALAAGGTGVQLSGFNFGFTAKNGNGWDNGQQDYLAAYVKLYNSGGGLAASYDYSSQTNRKYNWTNFNFSETFSSPVLASQFSNAQVGFVGRDTNYWAGNYGPEIYNVSFSLKYKVDPCALNPAYSPNCAGFSAVSTSGNLVPNPGAYAVYGGTVNNSYAINTALAYAGSGAMIHGFQWGYTANANGTYCASWFIVCWDEVTPGVRTNVNITNSAGASLYSVTREYTNSYNDTKYSYLFPSSQVMNTLGNFNFTAATYDSAYVGNMWSKALYTVDPCVANPLYSPTCPGYAVAYAKNLLLGSTVSAASAPSAPAPAPPAVQQAAPALASPTPDPTQPQMQQGPAPQQTAQQGPPPPPPAADPNQNPSVAQTDPAQPSPQQAGPAPTQPQPAGGPPQTATASAPPPSAGPSAGPSQAGPAKADGPKMTPGAALSVAKAAQEKDKAIQAAAVQQAAKAFEGAVQSSQASSNAAISMNQDMSSNSATAAAQFSSQSTQASMQAMVQTTQPQFTGQTTTSQSQANKIVQATQQTQVGVQQSFDSSSNTVMALKAPVTTVTETQQTLSSGTGLTLNRTPIGFNSFAITNSTSISLSTPAPTFQFKTDPKQFEVETPPMQTASFGGQTKAGDPFSDMMNQRMEMLQTNIEQRPDTVKKNVQPNDLAGGTDVAAMAQVPKGYEAYSLVILRDAPFYKPEAIYKDQRTVDNARVFRGLTGGSDAKHQQMVDSQYQLKN